MSRCSPGDNLCFLDVLSPFSHEMYSWPPFHLCPRDSLVSPSTTTRCMLDKGHPHVHPCYFVNPSKTTTTVTVTTTLARGPPSLKQRLWDRNSLHIGNFSRKYSVRHYNSRGYLQVSRSRTSVGAPEEYNIVRTLSPVPSLPSSKGPTGVPNPRGSSSPTI